MTLWVSNLFFNLKLSSASSWSRTTGFSRLWARWRGAPIPHWPRRMWGPWAWIPMGTGSSCSTCWRSMAMTPWCCRSSCAVVEGQRRLWDFQMLHQLASQTVPAYWCFSGTISITCIFTLLLHLVAVAPLLHSVMRRKRLDAALGQLCGLKLQVFWSIWKQWMTGQKLRREGVWAGKVEGSLHECQRKKQGHPVICSKLNPEDWRSGNIHERHLTCEQNPAFILLLSCRVLRVWIGLRLSADVAFLVSSAGFKHLYFIYLFIYFLIQVFVSVRFSFLEHPCCHRAQCLWSLLYK